MLEDAHLSITAIHGGFLKYGFPPHHPFYPLESIQRFWGIPLETPEPPLMP